MLHHGDVLTVLCNIAQSNKGEKHNTYTSPLLERKAPSAKSLHIYITQLFCFTRATLAILPCHMKNHHIHG